MMDETERPIGYENATSPSEAIVLGIAERTGQNLRELPALYEVIDPDALDAAVTRDRPFRVTFQYAGYMVTVAGPRDISIDESMADPMKKR